MIASNPAERAACPGLTRSTITAPSVKNVQGLMTAAARADPVLGAAIALGAVTGARRSELRAAVERRRLETAHIEDRPQMRVRRKHVIGIWLLCLEAPFWAVTAAREQSLETPCCRLTLWAPNLWGGNLADGAWRLTSLAWARQLSLSAVLIDSVGRGYRSLDVVRLENRYQGKCPKHHRVHRAAVSNKV